MSEKPKLHQLTEFQFPEHTLRTGLGTVSYGEWLSSEAVRINPVWGGCTSIRKDDDGRVALYAFGHMPERGATVVPTRRLSGGV